MTLTTPVVTGFHVIAPPPSSTTVRRRLLLRLRESVNSAPFFANDTPTLLEEEEDELSFEEASVLGMDDERLQDATVLGLSLHPHRPLGCTLEESLPDGDHVFVTKVSPNSHGAAGGLQVGDVILACSDLFGQGLAVLDSSNGLEQLRGLVQARPDHEPLELRVARGSSVLEQHEEALVELCANPGTSTTEIEDCLLDYMKQASAMPMSASPQQQDEECDPEEDENCLLDSAFDLWNEEFDEVMPPPVISKPDSDGEDENKAPKVKPWSSRSSPSGTFVRDPATGKMRNIDA